MYGLFYCVPQHSNRHGMYRLTRDFSTIQQHISGHKRKCEATIYTWPFFYVFLNFNTTCQLTLFLDLRPFIFGLKSIGWQRTSTLSFKGCSDSSVC